MIPPTMARTFLSLSLQKNKYLISVYLRTFNQRRIWPYWIYLWHFKVWNFHKKANIWNLLISERFSIGVYGDIAFIYCSLKFEAFIQKQISDICLSVKVSNLVRDSYTLFMNYTLEFESCIEKEVGWGARGEVLYLLGFGKPCDWSS